VFDGRRKESFMETNVTEKKLLNLLEDTDHHHVSLYMPTHQNGIEVRQDITRFKNCLKAVQDQLVSQRMRPADAKTFLEQTSHLLEDSSFWHHLARGLAIFISEKRFEIMRLPLDFQEIVVTGSRFHIKPLLRLFNENERFYLLALSANSCRFFLGTRDALTKISVKDMPASMEDTLRYDNPESQLQFHTGTAPSFGDRSAMYHGHGVGKDDSLDNIYRYLRQIDRALHSLLDTSSAPLLFTGVDSLFSLFKEISRSSSLLTNFVAGNPDSMKPHELHQRAWPLVEKHARERAYVTLDRYREYEGTDIASSDLRTIISYAFQGRVETLLIKAHEQVWGRYTPSHDRVVLHEERRNGDEDLIDDAAVYTLLKGGTVHVYEDPSRLGKPAAALFRF
jgi:hypothetical protein